jgi:Zn-dependent protease/CBS domain-containing protein
MHASIRLGRVHGVEIGLNWSWIFIFALIVWSLAASAFPATNPGLASGTYLGMAAVGALLLFASLILHELGHAVVAQREGMEIEGITLWVFGGVARFKGPFPSAAAELRIAIAGPAVSVALGVCFAAGAKLLPLPAAVDGVATWLGQINLVLVAFNMLPALPLDGGRVLRAALWARSGDFSSATRRAGGIAQAIGQAMIAFGIAVFLVLGALGGPWLALIGWFVLAAARAETAYGAMREALTGLRVTDAMISDPVTVDADSTLLAFLEDEFARTHYAAYPVVSRGRAVGIVAVGDVELIPPSALGRTRVRDRMLAVDRTLVLDEDRDLAEAITELLQTSLGRALVARDGRIVGLLSLTDAQALIERHARAAAAAGSAA